MTLSTSSKKLIGNVAALRKMKKRYLLLAVLGAAILISVIALALINMQRSDDWRKNTSKVTRGSIDVRIIATGTIKPVNEIKVSPKNTGLIKQLYVQQGDEVKAGQILAQMDDSNIRGQIEAARGNYLMAKDNYLKMRNGNRPQEVAIARYQERRARNIVQQAEQNIIRLKAQIESVSQQAIRDDTMAERQSYLDDQGAISDQDKLNAETQSKMTHAQLDAARKELSQAEATLLQNQAEHAAAQEQHELSRIGFRQEDIAQAQHAVIQAKGSLDTLQSQLNDMTIRAPFAGVITQKYADTGAIVTPTTSAATSSATSSSIVALAGRLEMVAEVAETDIGKIKLGQPVEIISNAYPDRVFHGRVTQIAPEAVVTQNVTTFEVHTTIDDESTGGSAAAALRHWHHHHGRDRSGNVAGDAASGDSDQQSGSFRHRHREDKTGQLSGDGGIAPPDQQSGATAKGRSEDGDALHNRLLSGMNVSARFVAGKLNDALLVPTVCIVSKHGHTGVLVAQPDGTPKFKPVETGPTVDTQTAVMHGLNEGDLVFLGLNKQQMDQQGYSDGSFGRGRDGGGGGRGGGGGAPIPRTFGR